MKKYRIFHEGNYWQVEYKQEDYDYWFFGTLTFTKWGAKRWIREQLKPTPPVTPKYEYYP
jgi:hypothetical protein